MGVGEVVLWGHWWFRRLRGPFWLFSGPFTPWPGGGPERFALEEYRRWLEHYQRVLEYELELVKRELEWVRRRLGEEGV